MTKIDFSSVAKRPDYGSTNTTAPTTNISVEIEDFDEPEKFKKTSMFFGFYVVLYACFLTSAAAIFVSLEAPKEMELRGNLLKMRQEFLTRFPNVRGIVFFFFLKFKIFWYSPEDFIVIIFNVNFGPSLLGH